MLSVWKKTFENVALVLLHKRSTISLLFSVIVVFPAQFFGFKIQNVHVSASGITKQELETRVSQLRAITEIDILKFATILQEMRKREQRR